ncbi:MAG: signal peptidase I [Sphingomonadaceae bacterium]|nr:signal peptidase I [Sphingomonadaceae bacterium]
MSTAPLTPREAHKALAAQQFAHVRAAVAFVFTAIVLAVGLRSFVLEPFNIPSDSMLPTLEAGDYLLVAKWPYGVGPYSMPVFMPVDRRVGGGLPRRGDVVVFKNPRDNRTDFIKRVIGLPGDRVRMVGGQVELNGALVPKIAAGTFSLAAPDARCRRRPADPCRYPRFVERIDGRSFATLDEEQGTSVDDTPLVTVPAGHYFVLGDNRDDSADSRLTLAEGGVGMVPAVNLVGRAEIIFFSTAGGTVRLSRIGTRL